MARISSPFAQRAKARQSRAALIESAPKISETIETSHIRDMNRMMNAFKSATMEQVGQVPSHTVHSIRSALEPLRERIPRAAEAFHPQALRTAERLEAFSKREATRTLGDLAADLPKHVEGFADAFAEQQAFKLEGLMTRALDDVEYQVSKEAVVESSFIGDVLDKWLSRAVNSATNSITQGTAELNRERQTEAGVQGFYWIAVHDTHVRPEHEALDNGEVYFWDDEPPLSADDSSSGEPCWPGTDYGCRCSAAPVIPESDDGSDNTDAESGNDGESQDLADA